MALWQARELPSRIYGWIPFATAMIVAEIPIAILGATICKAHHNLLYREV
jgi:ATP-binding cassette subfamily G (WHITE) protein 2 (SNQ2)